MASLNGGRMNIVVFNAGSSTLKASVFNLKAQGEGKAKSSSSTSDNDAIFKKTIDLNPKERGSYHDAALALLEGSFEGTLRKDDVDAVGHRIVQAGPNLRSATILSDEVVESIEHYADLAPNHNPPALEVIAATRRFFPQSLKQAVLFDTAFHNTLPPERRVYPLPYEWYENLGIKRYGFHGISHSYCSKRAEEMMSGQRKDSPLSEARHQGSSTDGELRVVVCHLGNGCSLAAVRGGICVDTTMGYTPLDGLMMGTRCGALDPGILIHVLKTKACSIGELETILNKNSGLLGISGISSDLRQVREASIKGDRRATLALNMFVHRLRQGIASMSASMEGLDAVVFTAGIGENSAFIRQRTATGLEYLGLELDEEKNDRSSADCFINTEASRAKILVIHTREDFEIARTTRRLVEKQA